MNVQPDLFGDYDRLQAEKDLWGQAHTCPYCGTTEPNGWLLRNNHGVNPGESAREDSVYDGECLAQHLVGNHIRYAVHYGNAYQLEHSRARGRALGLDVDGIESQARLGGAS